MTIQTRTQLPVYTAETLAAKNPVLLKGEVVYESDTRKHKVGDGTTAWNSLPYAGGGDTPDTIPAANVEQDASHRFVTDTEKDRWNAVSPSVPNLIWKVSEGSFLIKPSCSLDDPILAQCYIGFIRYKRRRNRKDRRVCPIGIGRMISVITSSIPMISRNLNGQSKSYRRYLSISSKQRHPPIRCLCLLDIERYRR